MITMHKAADRNPFPYAGYFARPAHCRLRVYTHPDRPTVIIATEVPTNPGTSITNRVEHLATLVIRASGIDPEGCIWIEHYPAGPRPLPERFAIVEFGRDQRGRLAKPHWTHVTRDHVERLIGRRLED